MRVVHLTSAHPRNDIRIFIKQCSSLAYKGYQTNLIVADGKGNENIAEVEIIDVGRADNRWQRILQVPKKIYRTALDINADIYHLHDPELLPIGIKLKKYGKRVIFDAHEDFPKQILCKPYLRKAIKKPLSILAAWYENHACYRFDAIIAATPHIRNKFSAINDNTIDINNFPIIGELNSGQREYFVRNEICYVGGYSVIRGLRELVNALPHTKDEVKLNLIGTCMDTQFTNSLKESKGWEKVNELGFQDRENVKKIFERCFAGIVTFLPVPNHLDAQPNKMFEYMSAGLPVIGSRFALWEEIIEGNNCGICVDPRNPLEIAKAINDLYEQPHTAYEMGMNGQKAIFEKYNWQQEEKKLFELYEQLK